MTFGNSIEMKETNMSQIKDRCQIFFNSLYYSIHSKLASISDNSTLIIDEKERNVKTDVKMLKI